MGSFYDEKDHKIYTRQLAGTIVDLFDQILYENGISISSDDENMDPDDNFGLQGDPYFDLLDRVEDLVIIALKEAQTKKIRTDDIVDILDGTERPSGNLPGIVEGCSVGGSTENLVKIKRATGCYNYGDAVQAIMNSDMWSDDKKNVIGMMPKDATHDKYEAVISVVRSTIWSNDKVNAIRDIFKWF